MLATFAIIIVLLAGCLALYTASRPDRFRISRSARMAASPAAIYPMIADLHAFNTWNPFLRHDPKTRIAYSGPQNGVGAAHVWEGNANVGKGCIEIVAATPPRRIAMKLHVMKPMQAHNDVVFTLEPVGDVTDVTWTMNGCSSFVSKLMGVFMSMDGMVGGESERGLSSLKRLVEKQR